MRKFITALLLLSLSACEHDYDWNNPARIDSYNPELHLYIKGANRSTAYEAGARVILYERYYDYRDNINAVDTIITDTSGLAKFTNLKTTEHYWWRIVKDCMSIQNKTDWSGSLMPHHRLEVYTTISAPNNLRVINNNDSSYRVTAPGYLPVDIRGKSSDIITAEAGAGILLAESKLDTLRLGYFVKCDSISTITIN